MRSYEQLPGKYSIPSLPTLYAQEGQGETLVLRIEDHVSGLEAELYYGVLEDQDVIILAVRIINWGTEAVTPWSRTSSGPQFFMAYSPWGASGTSAVISTAPS